jgi:hypothetical protein
MVQKKRRLGKMGRRKKGGGESCMKGEETKWNEGGKEGGKRRREEGRSERNEEGGKKE